MAPHLKIIVQGLATDEQCFSLWGYSLQYLGAMPGPSNRRQAGVRGWKYMEKSAAALSWKGVGLGSTRTCPSLRFGRIGFMMIHESLQGSPMMMLGETMVSSVFIAFQSSQVTCTRKLQTGGQITVSEVAAECAKPYLTLG